MKRKYTGIEHEPALGAEFRHDRAAPEPPHGVYPAADEAERIRDSAFSEPLRENRAADAFRRLLEERTDHSTLRGFRRVAIAGILGGILAIPGVFIGGSPQSTMLLNVIFFGPMVEEVMKQAGMIWLLEKRPWYLARSWQFPVAGALGGFLFATLENIVYRYLYLVRLEPAELDRVMAFRLVMCTALHVGCSLVSSLGMMHAWQKMRREGRPFLLTDCLAGLFTAIGIHGLYNFSASFLFR